MVEIERWRLDLIARELQVSSGWRNLSATTFYGDKIPSELEPFVKELCERNKIHSAIQTYDCEDSEFVLVIFTNDKYHSREIYEKLGNIWEGEGNFDEDEHKIVGKILGYPDCCIVSFSQNPKQAKQRIINFIEESNGENFLGFEKDKLKNGEEILYDSTKYPYFPYIPCSLDCKYFLRDVHNMSVVYSCRALFDIVKGLNEK